jgi:hypothetical protein
MGATLTRKATNSTRAIIIAHLPNAHLLLFDDLILTTSFYFYIPLHSIFSPGGRDHARTAQTDKLIAVISQPLAGQHRTKAASLEIAAVALIELDPDNEILPPQAPVHK